jgi:hypothetical protein
MHRYPRRTLTLTIALGAMAALAVACWPLGASAQTGPVPTTAAAKLPEGNVGIASKYPGDRDIENDPQVIFIERFDAGSIEKVSERWDAAGRETMSLSDDVPAGSADANSLLVTHVGGEGTGGQLYRRLLPGHKQLFARFYVKFDPDSAPIHHFGTHLGGFHPPTPWPQGGAGERPHGDARFTTAVEPFGKDWAWDFYTYWQGMRVHGDGRYWGTPFLAGAKKPHVERGQWICVEMMVKLNDPASESNGEQAFWIDGRLWRADKQVVSHIGPGFPRGQWSGGWWSPQVDRRDAFEGFRWRTSDDLLVNYVWAYVYITTAPRGHITKVWFDNIVIAREYVGPLP